jgi:hypothetical protein
MTSTSIQVPSAQNNSFLALSTVFVVAHIPGYLDPQKHAVPVLACKRRALTNESSILHMIKTGNPLMSSFTETIEKWREILTV